MQKERLFDGLKKIERINILGMFRSNEKYLEFFLKACVQLENKYDLDFRYFFIENNSTDNTKTLLQDFIKTRAKSKLMILNLKKDYQNIGDGRNFDRINSLSHIRNVLVKNSIPFDMNEWCLFVDSNIYFQLDILKKIFVECPCPSDENIGMMCMYTQQLFIPGVHKGIPETLTKPYLVNHFYDTFSFVDKQRKSFYPLCAFQKCQLCSPKHQELKSENAIPPTERVIDVTSAFGGFSLIKGDILNNPKIRWGTVSFDCIKDTSLCEHVLFCDRLKLLSEKRIVFLQNVNELYRTL
jgi:hypothetical protein